MKEFTIVMRGPAAVIFRELEKLLFEGFPTKQGPVNIRYGTRWLRRSESLTMPGHLWIEIVGKGSTLEESISPFANAGLVGLPIMALSANAAIGEAEVEVAFDSSSDAIERDYFQSYIPPEAGILHSGRLINVKATQVLIDAITKHSESERLLRAMNQYRLALNSWKFGHSTMVLAHLWMAIEALTKVKLGAELSARGLKTSRELANILGVELRQLDATIRRELILKGDSECYEKANEASNGFEHGYLGFDKILELSKEVRIRLAGYVRLAIFELSGLDETTVNILLSDPYDKPQGHWRIAKYLRGTLVGEGSQLAAPGKAYPFMQWSTKIKSFKLDKDGKFKVQFQESCTAELADGISFKAKSHEVWKLG